jgi:hypothetical protein
MEPPFLPHPVVKSTPIAQSPTRLIRLPKTDHTPSAPFTAAQGSLAFKNMSMISPLLPLSGMISLPILPRRGAPGHCRAGTISIFDGSSPVADSSSSTLKIDLPAALARLAFSMAHHLLQILHQACSKSTRSTWPTALERQCLIVSRCLPITLPAFTKC